MSHDHETWGATDGRCGCGGRIFSETRRGVVHLICASCNVCSECDAAGRKTYGDHGRATP